MNIVDNAMKHYKAANPMSRGNSIRQFRAVSPANKKDSAHFNGGYFLGVNNPDAYDFICNYDQFNQCVSELSRLHGVELYERYALAIKAPLAKEVKVDYTSLEFWKDAPEDATHYMPESGGWHKSWFTITEKTKTMVKVGLDDVFSCALYELSQLISDGLIPRPIQSPLYTQEMADNGVLPSVGMECMIKHKVWSKESRIKAVLLAVTNEYIIVKCDDSAHEQHYHINTISFSPLTPPITLIDGKAYQFECDNDSYHGIYNNSKDAFILFNGRVPVSGCTNIQPLTVEVIK